jgi:4-amino-4-deoxy-L-arabinose transferase-like glycosyltransferase
VNRGAWIRLLLAVAIAVMMIFARLGGLPLRDPDEGRNAEIAREMQANGAWLTPTYNGLVYLDKPAFFFRAVATSFSIFGENEFAARLPSALAACGILLMVYRFCRREYDLETATLAIVVVATTPAFFAMARHVMSDMILAFFVCGAIFSGYIAEQYDGARKRNWYLLSAAAAGFATLVKGPVGFLVPLLTLAVFNVVQKNSGWWRRLLHPLNAVVLLAIVLPWFLALVRAHPDFARYGLLEESFHRFTTKSFSRTAPFYYFALVVAGGLFAWSVLLPGAMKAAWQARARLAPADRLLMVWAIVVVIFFSISKSKLPHYILSAMIALAISTARVFAVAWKKPQGTAAGVVFRGLVAMGTLCLLLAIFLMPPVLAKVVKTRTVEFERVALTFGPAIVLLVSLGAIAMAARLLRNVKFAFVAFLVLPLSMVTIGFPAIARYSEASSSRELARALENLPVGTEVVGLESFAPGLPFYSQERVGLITGNGPELSNYIVYALGRSSVWPDGIVRNEDRETWLAARTNSVCLIAKGRALPELRKIADSRNLKVMELVPGWSSILIPARTNGYVARSN